MNRLWSRSGLRVLSILMLVFALVSGGFLRIARQHQQSNAAAYTQHQIDVALAQQRAAQQAANAPLLAAAHAAQTRAQQAAAAAAAAAARQAQQAEEAARRAHGTTSSRSQPRTTTDNGPIPSSCDAYTGNRALGCSVLLSEGFSLSQMPCLDKMWTKESNWRTTAKNPSSGSYGIPQALPADRMAAFGSDWKTNPVTQIKWGLDYIKNRYTSPCGAWTFWQAHNWY